MNSDFDVNWPAVEAHWQLEAELRSSPLRRAVSRVPKTGCGARIGAPFLGCALLGMFVLGFFLSLWAGLAVLILPFGSTTQGVITHHELTNGHSPRYGDSQSYMLQFEFVPVGGTPKYSGEWPVNGATFTRLRDGSETKVRYFPFAPGLRPILEDGVSPWLHILFMGPIGLVLLVVGGLSLSGFLPQSRAGKRLVQRGIVAPGVVIECKNGRAIFWFRVHDARGETRTIEVAQPINGQVWNLQPQQVVTVLFDARRLERAIVYRLCGWRAVI